MLSSAVVILALAASDTARVERSKAVIAGMQATLAELITLHHGAHARADAGAICLLRLANAATAQVRIARTVDLPMLRLAEADGKHLETVAQLETSIGSHAKAVAELRLRAQNCTPGAGDTKTTTDVVRTDVDPTAGQRVQPVVIEPRASDLRPPAASPF